MPANTIDYDALELEAHRGVIRSVLIEVARTGVLPGEHHFFISFDTHAPGVVLSKRLKEKYPADMTIVLQHRFWDLAVHEDRFEVKLTFDGIPERVVVPFKSIRVFLDPSVRYGLQFEELALIREPGLLAETGQDEGSERPGPKAVRPLPERKPRQPRKKADRTLGAEKPAEPTAVPAETPPAGSEADPAQASSSAPAQGPGLTQPRGPVGVPSTGGAQVVSLDAFRKK